MKKLVKSFKKLFFSGLCNLSHNSDSKAIANGWTRLTSKTILGKNCNFNGLIVYGKGEVVIGNNFHSGRNCEIYSQSHEYESGALPYDSTKKYYNVKIEDNVWFGSNVVVIGNVTIGEGAIIQVGSVVVKDIPPLSIAGGHPAKVFASRNRGHYEDLKAKGKFH